MHARHAHEKRHALSPVACHRRRHHPLVLRPLRSVFFSTPHTPLVYLKREEGKVLRLQRKRKRNQSSIYPEKETEKNTEG